MQDLAQLFIYCGQISLWQNLKCSFWMLSECISACFSPQEILVRSGCKIHPRTLPLPLLYPTHLSPLFSFQVLRTPCTVNYRYQRYWHVSPSRQEFNQRDDFLQRLSGRSLQRDTSSLLNYARHEGNLPRLVGYNELIHSTPRTLIANFLSFMFKSKRYTPITGCYVNTLSNTLWFGQHSEVCTSTNHVIFESLIARSLGNRSLISLTKVEFILGTSLCVRLYTIHIPSKTQQTTSYQGQMQDVYCRLRCERPRIRAQLDPLRVCL